MNIGFVSNSVLQTTHQGHNALGLQPNAQPQSAQESLTRINPTQNTASSENKTGQSKQEEQHAAPLIEKEKKDTQNTKDYSQHDDKDGKNKNERRAPENPHGLTEEELKEVTELERRDQEVRAHEAAHMAAAGQYASGGIKYDFKRGPDGVSYAVGGEVNIDTSAVPGNPEATIRKANQIKAAALAPADPSGQDKAVAAEATRMAAQARTELMEEKLDAVDTRKEAFQKHVEEQKANSAEKEPEKSAASRAYEIIQQLNGDDTEKSSGLLNQVA